MAETKGGKKRFWSDEEKRSICLQAQAPGVSVAQVARRYAMNANLIHTWLKDERFAPPSEDGSAAAIEASFHEVTLDPPGLPDFATAIDASSRVSNEPVSANRVDISLSDGRRILIEGPTTLLAIVGLVEGLTV